MLFKPKTDSRSTHHKDLRSTHPKSKRIFTKLTALITSLALSLTVLPTTALAGDFVGASTGGTQAAGVGNYPYGYGGTNLAWRIDLYVSASETGKIDPQTDRIDGKKLPWVSGVVLTPFGNTAYLQADYTANRTPLSKSILDTESDEEGFLTHMYNLPLCYQNKPSLSEMVGRTQMTLDGLKSGGRKVYVEHEMFGLPSDADDITNDTTYKKLVKDVIESKE